MKFEVEGDGKAADDVSGVDTDGVNVFHGFFGGVNVDVSGVSTGVGDSKLSCRQVVTFLAETFSAGRSFCSSAKISENEVEVPEFFDQPDHAGGVGGFGWAGIERK